MTRYEIARALAECCKDEHHINCGICPFYEWVSNKYKITCRQQLMKLAYTAITNNRINALICHEEEVKADEIP